MSVDLIINLLFVFIAILISMTLHEAMHAYVGHALGDDTAKHMGRLTLNPFAHIDLFTTILLPLMLVAVGAPPFGMAKPVPSNPHKLKFEEFGMAMVGIAGPLTNLVLASASGLLLQLVNLPFMVEYFFLVFCLVNITFFLFNIIPFPPLDGSRVLYAFAPDFVKRGMDIVESAGIFAIFGFFVIFYLFLEVPFTQLINVIFTFITGQSLT